MPRRRASRSKSRSTALLGALLLLVTPFVPSFAIGIYYGPGQIFPSFSGGIRWPWLDLVSILILIMGVLALIGLLIDGGDVSMVLLVLAGVLGLILGIVGLIGFLGSGIIFAFAPACAILGGLLALFGALRVRV
ncbi:MAG: hypothetical protein QXG44_06710 [Candidatus Jordarchaeaceae archaeon]